MPVRTSICRVCNAYCPMDVTINDGRVAKAEGNHRAPLYHGYSCPKGRALPHLHNHADRLLTSMKRQPDGSFKPISSADLVDELSEKIGALLKNHGPRSIAAYLSGSVNEQPAASAMMVSFLAAIGSPMLFSATTIDQPGLLIADALHGKWQGGRITPENLDVFVIVGGNPINSKQYLPQNPGQQIKEMRRRGAKLVVIDPRRTETARLADVHLQPLPGEDPTIFAGLLHLIIAEGGVNRAFVDLNAQGFDALAESVRPFTPDYVAKRSGLDEADLRAVARIMIDARKGDVALGTGPSMATRGVLSSYLAMCLNTVRGFWAQEGDDAMHPSVLLPRREFRAQPGPAKPAWGFGAKTRIRGLQETSSGMPLAALPEEILTPGEGKVRALILHGGAVNSWPQQSKTLEALRALDLLVIHETVMSPTARMADYVVATKAQFEVPAITLLNEMVASISHSGYGYAGPFAFCQPALVQPPAGSDLLDAWQIYYRIASRLSIPLKINNWRSKEISETPPIDPVNEPTTEQIYDLMCRGSAVPIEEVRKYPDGHIFEQARETVQPRDSDCNDRFELANLEMLEQLRVVRTEDPVVRRKTDRNFPFQLIPSRMQNSQNTSVRIPGVLKSGYNPLFMNPEDMERLALKDGDQVGIRSRHGQVSAFVGQDVGLRRGVVALMHGFGGLPGPDYDPRRDGTNVNQLTDWTDDNDPYMGMPRMGALPVAVTRIDRAAADVHTEA